MSCFEIFINFRMRLLAMHEIIILKPLLHKRHKQIGIWFDYNASIKAYIMNFAGVKWTATHKCFYILYSKAHLHALFTYLKAGHYYVDYSAFSLKQAVNPKPKSKVKPPHKLELYRALTLGQQEDLKGFVNYMEGKRLSKSTISTYGYFVLRFLHFVKDVEQVDLKTEHIERYMEAIIAKEYYSISSHRQCVSALKHFTTFYNLPEFDAEHFKRPKRSKYLPTVLSKKAVIQLMQVTKNLKHRTVIGLLYSSGLRIGELLRLELKDLDFDRNQILIRQGKGRKDRLVGMSQVIQPLLLNYLKTYKPERYVIEGRNGDQYSPSSVRRFLKQSCKLAGISKPVTPHTLRHSYATHMLENGVDIRFIQELLGHSKPETTMIYTHVAQKDLLHIQNPLDEAVSGILKSVNGDKKVFISGMKTD